MGSQKWLCLCAPIFLNHFCRSSWCVFITGKSNLKRETSNSTAGSSKNFFLSQLSGVPDVSSASNDNEVDYEDYTETQGVTRYVYICNEQY